MAGFGPVAARDAAIGALALALWSADRALIGEPTLAAHAIALGAGVLTAVCGYLAHEWGHLAAAIASGAVVHAPESWRTVFLFQFDTGQSSSRQFLAMSLGGYAASAIVVVALVALLPLDALSGRVAATLTGLGVLATIVLELPPFLKVWRGGSMPAGSVYRNDAPAVDSKRSATSSP